MGSLSGGSGTLGRKLDPHVWPGIILYFVTYTASPGQTENVLCSMDSLAVCPGSANQGKMH